MGGYSLTVRVGPPRAASGVRRDTDGDTGGCRPQTLLFIDEEPPSPCHLTDGLLRSPDGQPNLGDFRTGGGLTLHGVCDSW